MIKSAAILLILTFSLVRGNFIVSAQTVHPSVTATLLGQTGEDMVGPRSLGRDGVFDVHIRLSGVSGSISKIRIAGLDGVWEMPLNAQNNWLVVAVPTSDPSVVDVYFNYFKSIATYTLTITYSDGQTQAVSTVAGTITHPAVTATLLGQTGEDIVGPRSQGKDGVLDVHIQLSGVSGAISKIRIVGLDGVWEMPLNAQNNWLVVALSTSDPSVVDVYFNHFKSIATYTLTITYFDGQTQTVSTVAPSTAHPPLTAILLGRTGEDVVGNRSQGRDGVLDVHVQLTGVSGAISKIRIVGLDGVWEMPLNAQNNWLVSAVPTSDPSVFDVFFNYFKTISSYALTVTYTDGQSQTVNTTVAPPIVVPVAFNFSILNGGDQAINPGSSTTNTVTATLVSGSAQQLSFSVAGSPAGSLASFSTGSCSPTCLTSLSINTTSSTAPGNYPITVTAVGGGLTKTSSFTLSVIAPPAAPTQTYYVSSGVGPGAQAAGNDSNPGTLAQPFKTLHKAIPLLQPGYTLIVRGGEYDTVNGLANGGNSIIPSGDSWDQPVTIKAYPGETPVFRRFVPAGNGLTESQIQTGVYMPTQQECEELWGWGANYPWGCWSGGGSGGVRGLGSLLNGYLLLMWNSASNPVQYIVFDGIVFDARGIVAGISFGVGSIHIRFQNSEVRNVPQSCFTQPGTPEDNSFHADLQFINVKVHHCGVPYDPNMINGIPAREHLAHRFHQSWYMHSGGVLWDGVEVYKVGGAGVSPLGTQNVIRNSYFHDFNAMGIICAGGWDFYNNVIVQPNSSQGIYTYGCNIKNNTIIAAGDGIFLDQYNSGTDIIENNIILGDNAGIYSNQIAGPRPLARNNLIVTKNPGREIFESTKDVINIQKQSNILGQDPRFINAAAGDFRLQPGSPAIGKATDGGDLGARR